MPTTLASPIARIRPPALSLEDAISSAAIMPLTVEQYQTMIEQGIVPADANYELLRGVIVRKDRSSAGETSMAHGLLHQFIVTLLFELGIKIRAAGRFLRIQLPLICPPDGAPEPDASIVRGEPRDYVGRAPTAADASCVIEVADSSLRRDRIDKAAIYAAAGIGQYIIINIDNLTLEVHTDPDRAAGTYGSKSTLHKWEILSLSLPGGTTFPVSAADLLP